ncbi:MAG: EamA family transporter [Prevotella sp.]|nr:EamA family transporter [Prevotella sp.]MCF0208724.1 EamA family transporter [Bacteroidaceae bacterium]
MIKYTVAFISIALGSAAQYFLKVGMSQMPQTVSVWDKVVYALSSVNVWTGLLCYGLSMVFWLYVLSVMELSRAYPLVSLGYVFTLVIGYYLLHEPVNMWRVIGVMLIMLGVFFISK